MKKINSPNSGASNQSKIPIPINTKGATRSYLNYLKDRERLYLEIDVRRQHRKERISKKNTRRKSVLSQEFLRNNDTPEINPPIIYHKRSHSSDEALISKQDLSSTSTPRKTASQDSIHSRIDQYFEAEDFDSDKSHILQTRIKPELPLCALSNPIDIDMADKAINNVAKALNSLSFRPIEQFSGLPNEDMTITEFFENLDRHIIATGMASPERVKDPDNPGQTKPNPDKDVPEKELLRMYLKGPAKIWFRSLAPTKSYEDCKTFLTNKFQLKEQQKHARKTKLYKMTQEPNEDYFHYVTRVISRSRGLDVPDSDIKAIVMHGASPKIKNFLIMSDPSSLDALLNLPLAKGLEQENETGYVNATSMIPGDDERRTFSPTASRDRSRSPARSALRRNSGHDYNGGPYPSTSYSNQQNRSSHNDDRWINNSNNRGPRSPRDYDEDSYFASPYRDDGYAYQDEDKYSDQEYDDNYEYDNDYEYDNSRENYDRYGNEEDYGYKRHGKYDGEEDRSMHENY